MRHEMSRRQFSGMAGAALAAFVFSDACGVDSAPFAGGNGRLTARPRADNDPPRRLESGPLGLETGRDAILRRLGSAPADAGIVVLSPDSRGGTWDAIRSGFGPDVEYLDRALKRV